MSDNDPNESTYNKLNHYTNESQLSDYRNHKNDGDISDRASDYDSYTSNFNFGSRVQNYKAKKAAKIDDFCSASSNAYDSQINDYIPPKNKIDYTKEEYPSENKEEHETYVPKNYTPEFTSNTSDLYYQSNPWVNQVNVNNNSKILINKQETIDYNSVYDSAQNYFSRGADPK